MIDPKKRVLLVDDDEEFRGAVQLALEERGYDVLLAGDGAEALVRVERDNPDLVVLDVVMPKRSGFLVLDRLRRYSKRSLRIIVVTANDEPRHREFAHSYNIDAFLGKPFKMERLLTTVDDCLQTSRDGVS